MYYDLKIFGKKICSIRNKLGYTQKDVSELTSINPDTLRKIENGKVTPNQYTLELLSPVLKVDLNRLLLRYRIANYSAFSQIESSIEYKLENGIYETLHEDLDSMEGLLKGLDTESYIANRISQLTLLVESVILKIKYKDYKQSLEKLNNAIKITTPSFKMSKYNSFVYSNMEIRILMNIALLINITNTKEKGLEILEFCLTSIEKEDVEFRIKILYNLSYNCHRLDLNERTLFYADEGINTCIKNNNLSCLALLYSRKAIAEYFLKINNYTDSLDKAIAMYEITGQDKLKRMFLNACAEYAIKLSNIEAIKIL